MGLASSDQGLGFLVNAVRRSQDLIAHGVEASVFRVCRHRQARSVN